MEWRKAAQHGPALRLRALGLPFIRFRGASAVKQSAPIWIFKNNICGQGLPAYTASTQSNSFFALSSFTFLL